MGEGYAIGFVESPDFGGRTLAERWAIIVAVEKYRHRAWAGVPYAESAAGGLSAALVTDGIESSRQVVLVGADATKGVIEASLGRLKKRVKKGDTLLAFVSARMIVGGDSTYLVPWDAVPDLAVETSVSVGDILAGLWKSKADNVAVFLDPAGEWTAEEFREVPGISSCSPGEASSVSAELRSSLWLHLVAGALIGDAGVSLNSIRQHVWNEFPRLFRRHAAADSIQTPIRFGPAVDVPIRDRKTSVDRVPVLDPGRLNRMVFRRESRVKVKALAGFKKVHQAPVAATQAARSFVARLAAGEVREELDRAYEAVRSRFGYKRKEIDRGPDRLVTPDFEYAVSVDLHPDDPAVAVIRCDLCRFGDATLVRSEPFLAFIRPFDSLVFEFLDPLDVAAFVDRLEEMPKAVATLNLAADGRTCEATIPGIAGRIVVGRHSLTIHGRSGGLLDLLLAFLSAVGPIGDRPALSTPGGKH